MARVSQVLVILVVALAIAKPFSLPPAKFLKDFALKYQRSSIVMSIPKEISLNQVVKRYVIVTPVISKSVLGIRKYLFILQISIMYRFMENSLISILMLSIKKYLLIFPVFYSTIFEVT